MAFLVRPGNLSSQNLPIWGRIMKLQIGLTLATAFLVLLTVATWRAAKQK